jgi:hypothetical protein
MMPHRSGITESLLRAIDPLAVRNFLINSGFELSGKQADLAEAYRIDNGPIVILPLQQNSYEYAKLLSSLLEFVGHKMSLPFDDVLGLIARPNSDILRYKIETDESKFGHIRADEIKTATAGLYNTLLNSAQKIARIKNRLQIRSSAEAYAGACHFGQTEYGSFVLKVFCPTSDIGARTENSEPYCREVTRGVVENFQFLAQGNVDDPEVPPPQTMSKDVARSIMEMHPATPLTFSAGLSVRFSPLKDLLPNTQESCRSQAELQEMQFKNHLFERAEKVYQRYRKAEEFQRETLTGFITDLHMDPPTEKKRQDFDIIHQITMELRFGNGTRKVTSRMMPKDYLQAVEWHAQEIEIVLDAVIDKRSNKWVVHDLFGLKPREGRSEPKLF